jgi:hypothetical protein
MERELGVSVGAKEIAACIGTKEFVAGLPHWLRLRTPDRDTVLYPAISYPSYAMGAELAGARAVPVPVTADGRSDLDAIDPADAARALCLWVNSPGNPTGHLDDLEAAAKWGRAHNVPVISDECYVEFTWDGPGRTILEHGLDGAVASVRDPAGHAELLGPVAQVPDGGTGLGLGVGPWVGHLGLPAEPGRGAHEPLVGRRCGAPGGTGDPHLQAAEEGLTQAYVSESRTQLHDWANRQAVASKVRTVGIYSGALGYGYNEELLKKQNLPVLYTSQPN